VPRHCENNPDICLTTEEKARKNLSQDSLGDTYYALILTDFTRGASKSLVRPTSQCILFDDENISFDANVVIYIYI
jgi:hypothetical protein